MAAAAEPAHEEPEEKPPEVTEPAPIPAKPARPRKPKRIVPEVIHDLPGTTPASTQSQASLLTAVPPLPDTRNREREMPAAAAPDVLINPGIPGEGGSERHDIRNLIDAATVRQPPKDLLALSQPMPREGEKTSPTAELDIRIPLQLSNERQTDRFILLSRTLAGLVDWIIVFICTASIIFTVDVVEGIDVFDTVSVFHYGLLLLATYFVYSLFFLGTAGQTIGMMLTDLKIVNSPIGRPSVGQMLTRCCVFLLGCAGLGAGLLWGCFDGQSCCLHDRLSRTRVTRISLC